MDASFAGEEKPLERKANSARHANWWGGTGRVGYAVSTVQVADETLEDFDVPTVTSFFAVYDGHGGPAVAQYCANHFHIEVLNHPEFSCNLLNAVKRAFFRCLVDMTYIISKLFFHNRRIIMRIRHSGYSISHSRGACCIDDGIALSIVTGNMRFKKKKSRQTLTSSPEIRSENITDDTQFLVIACDGIWDVLQNQEVVHYVGPHIRSITEVEMKDEDVCDRKCTLAKKLVTSSDGAANLGISTKHTRKAVNPPLRVLNICQIWVFLLFILTLASPVLPSKRDEANEMGSCRFDKTSVAMLSCIQTNGKYWSPPSTSCCNALLYAIDILPASNESGACCLCRYIKKKSVIELVTSYVLCQGKDNHIVTKWSFPITTCARACPRNSGKGTIATAEKDGSTTGHADEDRPLVDGHDSDKNIFPWRVVTFSCMVLFVCFGWYFCWTKLVAKVQSLPRNLQRQGLPPLDSDRVEPRRSSGERRRRSLGQHRMSSASVS